MLRVSGVSLLRVLWNLVGLAEHGTAAHQQPSATAHVETPSGPWKRADPVESRQDFVGYHAEGGGNYDPVFCSEGETATSIGTMFDCCPSGGSCRFGIGCSTQYLMITMLETPAPGKTSSLDCLAVTSGNSCVSKFIYQDFDQTNSPLVWVGCRSKLGITKSASYYRTLGSGVRTTPPATAANTGSSLRQTTQTNSRSTITAVNGVAGDPDHNSLSAAPRPTADPAHNHTVTATTNSTEASEPSTSDPLVPSETAGSPLTLSPSDKIAIGVGVGIGLPTVVIGLLAWLFPRNRWRRERVLVVSTESLVGAMKHGGAEKQTSDHEETE